ncbi:MAG: CobW family GTP-binding protein [Candidatus Rokuibacteriota bacterium]
MASADLIPVNIVTGFLGSGKTTLLQRLLASPELANTAVLVNELGEIGLDHLLLRHVDETTVVLPSGCVCCAIRDDLTAAIRDLYSQREQGTIPRFDRLAIETTGLADPAPIIFTLMAEPVLRHHFRVGHVVTTVDAVNGAMHLAQHPESVKQVAVADRIVLTKTDLAGRAPAEALRTACRRYNPVAPIFEPAVDPIGPDELFTDDLADPSGPGRDARRWLGAAAAATAPETAAGHVSPHDRDIYSFSVTVDHALDWTAFGIWLTMLLHAHGEDVLRVKGMLQVVGVPAPVVIHGVQHLVHPPVHLDAWPTADRGTRLVFIVRKLSRQVIERSLAAFNRLAAVGEGAA